MMKCEDVLDALQRTGPRAEAERRAATEHLAGCENCRNAAHALAVLRADRDLPIQAPSEGAFGRAMLAATTAHELFPPRRPASYWLGVGSGLALAAGIAGAVLLLRPLVEPPAPDVPALSVPTVTLAVNEARDVNVALTSPGPLAGAEIHVSLNGEVGLRGFDDQRELRWQTDLDQGVNQLTLPVVALGPHGGQVLVEVQYGDKRRAFVVDVRATQREPTASLERVGRAQARGACSGCGEPETV